MRDGVVYLLHFDQPYGHARHYMGWTVDLDRRLAEHRSGLARAGRLPQVFAQHGIPFTLARTWIGDRNRERSLKRQGGHARKCPLCVAVGGSRRRARAADTVGGENVAR